MCLSRTLLRIIESGSRLVNTPSSPDGAVAESSATELVGIGFASRYWLQPRAGFFLKVQCVGVRHCPGQRNRRGSVPVPVTGVRYNSLL